MNGKHDKCIDVRYEFWQDPNDNTFHVHKWRIYRYNKLRCEVVKYNDGYVGTGGTTYNFKTGN